MTDTATIGLGSHCHHGNGKYSVTIEVKGKQTSVTSYENRGCKTSVTIFDMTPAEMEQLAEELLDLANCIVEGNDS